MIDIQITKRHTDPNTNRLFGIGRYSLPDQQARRIHASGKGRIVDENIAGAMDAAIVAQGGVVPEQIPNPRMPQPAEQPRMLGAQAEGTGSNAKEPASSDKSGGPTSDLPEDFPEREKLAQLGFTTIESLTTKEAGDKISDEFNKGTANKIGLAVNKARGV